MADLVVIVPSRGRPHAVAEMAEAFELTCTADTSVVFVVDQDDPTADQYPVYAQPYNLPPARCRAVIRPSDSMVSALNGQALVEISSDPPRDRRGWQQWDQPIIPMPLALAFLGDDHRPRTVGWDRAYLDALAAKPGIVYGNDLIQCEQLPTQCAMSTEVVQALGHMAPPVLTHLYADNYWRDLGKAAGCLTYLPDVIVEHVHPASGKVDMDEGYRRVNAPEMYERDSAAYRAYMAEHGVRDVAAVRAALAGAAA